MKNSTPTFMQKIGFADSDLKSVVHDEYCKWFYNNYKEIVLGFVETTNLPKTKTLIDTGNKFSGKAFGQNWWENLLMVKWKNETNKENMLEKNCSCGEKFTTWMCDWNNNSFGTLELYGVCENFKNHIEITCDWEHPIRSNGYFIGYIDFLVKVKHESTTLKVFGVEIKTFIPNLGELLRQINTYRSCLKDYDYKSKIDFLLIAPPNFDSENIQICESQGIRVIIKSEGDYGNSEN